MEIAKPVRVIRHYRVEVKEMVEVEVLSEGHWTKEGEEDHM